MRTPRPKSVQFDVPSSPELERRQRHGNDGGSDEEGSDQRQHNVEHGTEDEERKHRWDPRQEDQDNTGNDIDHQAQYEDGARDDRQGRRSGSRSGEGQVLGSSRMQRQDTSDSDATVDLPPRFDEQGNRRREDPLADKINDILAGRGTAGGLFRRLTGDLLGGNGGVDEGNGSGNGRSRRRRRT